MPTTSIDNRPTFEVTHLSQAQISTMPSDELLAIVRSTVPTGVFAAEVVWARTELQRRKVPA